MQRAMDADMRPVGFQRLVLSPRLSLEYRRADHDITQRWWLIDLRWKRLVGWKGQDIRSTARLAITLIQLGPFALADDPQGQRCAPIAAERATYPGL
jgi:hypothetical protein